MVMAGRSSSSTVRARAPTSPGGYGGARVLPLSVLLPLRSCVAVSLPCACGKVSSLSIWLLCPHRAPGPVTRALSSWVSQNGVAQQGPPYP